jgi:hypothetical protein
VAGALALLLVLLRLRARPTAARAAAPARNAPTAWFALIYAREERAGQLAAALAIRCVQVKSSEELAAVLSNETPAVAFIDIELMPQLTRQLDSRDLRVAGSTSEWKGGSVERFPIVAIIDEPANARLPRVVRSLDAFGALGHVIAAPLLDSPQAKAHLDALVERLLHDPEHDQIAATGVGRVAMLAQASHREARFERMREYFARQGVSSRTATALNDVAEELVMNALYNAPAEAGYFEAPVSRTEDVTLPAERACQISYGLHEGNAFVRLRDTFGTLRRERLLEVLTRCLDTTGVALDESRGGAGLGMWRVFSNATTIAITVLPGRLTDIFVELAPKPGKGNRLLAVTLTFACDREEDRKVDPPMLDFDSPLLDNSVTLVGATA